MRRFVWVLASLAIVLLVSILYVPALGLELAGDDYLLVQLAHRAVERPTLLLAPLGTFFRPTTTWTLVLDRTLWGTNPAGYHLSNLVFHTAAALLLMAAARRLGIPLAWAWGLAVLWAASPLTAGPAMGVGARIDLLLLLGWLAMIILWPQPDERWGAGRALAVASCTAWLLLSKETWVVTPALVFLLEAFHRRVPPKRAVGTAALFAVPAGAYVVVYFLLMPGSKGYFDWSIAPVAKLAHLAAACLHFEPLRVAGFALGWRGLLASLLVVAAVVHGVRRRLPAAAVGPGLALLVSLPTLLVPYLPSRYAAIPYAGFLLLAAAVLSDLAESRGRRLVGPAALALAAVLAVSDAVAVRTDIADLRPVSEAHARLIAEARAVAGELPLHTPLVLVRGENRNVYEQPEVSVHGTGKLYFVRTRHPYGLADASAVFEWAIGRDDTFVNAVDPTDPTLAGRPGPSLCTAWAGSPGGPGASRT